MLKLRIIYVSAILTSVALASGPHHHKYRPNEDMFWILVIIAIGICSRD